MQSINVKWDEDYRHQCEVRHCIQWARKSKWGPVMDYFEKIKVESRLKKLKHDVKDQWQKGNIGEYDVWL